MSTTPDVKEISFTEAVQLLGGTASDAENLTAATDTETTPAHKQVAQAGDVAGVSSATIVRVVIALLAIVNMILSKFGLSPLDVTGDEVATIVSSLWLIVSTGWAIWKDNPFTFKARVLRS